MDPVPDATNGASPLESCPPPARSTRRFSDALDSIRSIAQIGRRFAPRPKSTHFGGSSALHVASPSMPHHCTSDTCAVTKLFHMPELLTIVLDFLDDSDVMTLRRVSRIWVETVRGSPRLRLRSFVQPQWHRLPANFILVDPKVEGLKLHRGDPVHLGQWIHIIMNVAAARRILSACGVSPQPRAPSMFVGLRGGLGSSSRTATDSWPAMPLPRESADKYQNLHICQPPILGMQATVINPGEETGGDEDENSPAPVACIKLSCDTGITLDFLAETTISLLRSRNAIDAEVVYKSIISFCQPSQSTRKPGMAQRSVIGISE